MFSRHAFTLVEMAVVLVIIGLVIGGTLSGAELIRHAGLRGDIETTQKLKSATLAFISKYNCLPGDCIDVGGLVGAKRGNGDGKITGGLGIGQLYFEYGDGSEFYNYFDHLARAQLIALAPFDVTNPGPVKINTQILGLKRYTNTGVIVGCVNNAGVYGPCHFMLMGLSANVGDDKFDMRDKPYTPSDAYYIDNKMDDGIPESGKVISIYPTSFDDSGHWSPANTMGYTACGTPTAYDFTRNDKVCGLRINAGF